MHNLLLRVQSAHCGGHAFRRFTLSGSASEVDFPVATRQDFGDSEAIPSKYAAPDETGPSRARKSESPAPQEPAQASVLPRKHNGGIVRPLNVYSF